MLEIIGSQSLRKKNTLPFETAESHKCHLRGVRITSAYTRVQGEWISVEARRDPTPQVLWK